MFAEYSIAPGNILVAGDSILKGVSYDEKRKRLVLLKESFCAEAAKLLRPAVENISRFGLKSGELFTLLYEKLQNILKSGEQLPSLVLIEVGGNDCDFDWDAVASEPKAAHFPNTALSEYSKNLERIITLVKDAGSQPVLCNLPPIDADRYFLSISKSEPTRAKRLLEFLGEVGRIYWWHERYSAALSRIAQATRTPLLLFREAILATDDYRKYISGDGLHLNCSGHAALLNTVLEYISQYAPSLLNKS